MDMDLDMVGMDYGCGYGMDMGMLLIWCNFPPPTHWRSSKPVAQDPTPHYTHHTSMCCRKLIKLNPNRSGSEIWIWRAGDRVLGNRWGFHAGVPHACFFRLKSPQL